MGFGRALRTPARRILASDGLGYGIDVLCLLLLVALLARYQWGHIPKFFTIVFPLTVLGWTLAAAAFVVRRTGKAAGDFVLSTLVTSTVLVVGLTLTGYFPTTPAVIHRQELAEAHRLYRHPLPGDLALFLTGFDKGSVKSFEDFPRAGGLYRDQWEGELMAQGFTKRQAGAISLMLFTSTLWAYGNEKHPDRTGCITNNEENNWIVQQPDLKAVVKANIGCCNDYAFALSLLLSRHGFENRYVIIPGHIFNEAKIDGKWMTLDANTNLFVTSSWEDFHSTDGTVHVFSHPGATNGRLRREVIAPFQQYVTNLLLMGPLPQMTRYAGRPLDEKPELALLYHSLIEIGDD